MQRGERAGVCAPERAAQAHARGVDRVRIDVLADLAGDVGLGRQAHRERREGVIDAPRADVLDQRAEGRRKSAVALGRAAVPNRLDAPQEDPRRQTLQRLPAVEIVAVVPGEDDEILLGQVVVDPDRRGESPQERQGRTLRDITKDDRPLGVLKLEHAALKFIGARVRRRQRHIAAVGADQAERERHRHRQLDVLPRRRSQRLRNVEPIGLGCRDRRRPEP